MSDPTSAPPRSQPKPLPSLAILDELFSYDPEDGVLRWRTARRNGGSIPAGSIAGCVKSHGYRVIHVNGSRYRANRLAFKLHHRREPAGQIDHRDTDKDNNRIGNLREASGSGNQWNKKTPSTNTSGVKGVCWHKGSGRWRAQLRVNGKGIHVGHFNTIEDADAAIRAARERLHGEFANHG